MTFRLTRQARGFTLIEMMVSLSLLTLIALVMFTITNQTTKIWQYTTSRSEQFNNAALAFQTITQRVSQATLNTYWDYDNQTTPTKYVRKSELRFLVDAARTTVPADAKPGRGSSIFFQAPLGFVNSGDDTALYGGLPNLLDTWGYYIAFDADERPQPIVSLDKLAPPLRYRYRLMELMDPSNYLGVYSYGATSTKWYQEPLLRGLNSTASSGAKATRATHVLAENIIALAFLPQLSAADAAKYQKDNNKTKVQAALSPDYLYDSTIVGKGSNSWLNQLPPVVQVTMIAIDENSARRAAVAGATTPPAKIDAFVSGLFVSAASYDDDIVKVNKTLADPAQMGQTINYRIFTSNVSIRGARWSPN